MKNFVGLFDALRRRGHISEHRLDELGRAGNPGQKATSGELDHMRACDECRGLAVGFRRANAVLEGPWADRPAAAHARGVSMVSLGGSLRSRGRTGSRPVGLRPALSIGALAAVALLTFGVIAVAPRPGSAATDGASTAGSPSESAPAVTGTGAFKATGSMSIGRGQPVATTLEDGRVLVTGAMYPDDPNAPADLYDPATGTFTRTGPMIQGDRAGQTATLLADGRVLIAGGAEMGPSGQPWPLGSSGSLKSAELFDPATGKFTATGSMNEAREQATATLLADGRVLIAGGATATPKESQGTYNSYNLASAELYDPSTGTFTKTGSMTTARRGHSAIPLRDGRVLVTGGSGPDEYSLDSAELYDPSTGRFAATGPMGNGDVYGPTWTMGAWSLGTDAHGEPIWPAGVGSDGGMVALLKDGRVLAAGNALTNYGTQDRASAWLYDPATGKFSQTGSMLNPGGAGTATVLSDGQVLIANAFGIGDTDKLAVTAELYDPATGTFRAAASMPSVRSLSAVALLKDGRVLFVGGTGPAGEDLATAVLFDPAATP